MASMGKPDTKVGEFCKELGISRQTLYRHVARTAKYARPAGAVSKVEAGTPELVSSAKDAPHVPPQFFMFCLDTAEVHPERWTRDQAAWAV
jgi:hypothetical protein